MSTNYGTIISIYFYRPSIKARGIYTEIFLYGISITSKYG